MDFAGDAALLAVAGNLQIVARLKIYPEFRSGTEKTSESQGRIGSDGAAAIDDFRHARHGNAKFQREAIHAQAQGPHELFAQNLAGVNGLQFCGHFCTSVVISNFDFVRIAVAPNKTEPPLIVNADAVLSVTVAAQRFQPIARERRQVLKLLSGVQHCQFSQRRLLEALKLPDTIAMKKAFRQRRAKRLDHGPMV